MPPPAAPVRHDYTFASDNTAGIAPEALAAVIAANTGSAPSYGKDEWTRRARELVAGVFETECDVFFVGNGTAANALAFSALCHRHHSILCHTLSHVDNDECGAPEFFTGGSKVIPIPGPAGKLQPADVERTIGRRTDLHYPKPGALTLTQATELGTVYTPAEVGALGETARRHGLAVQMDGARFTNAAAALAGRGHRPADFTWRAGVDVLSFGGDKNGMNGTEAVVFFNRPLAREFEYRVKQSAQLNSKLRFATAQWVAMIESGAWLKHGAHANAMARRLAGHLQTMPQLKLLAEPEANGVFAEMPVAAVELMWARGWHFHRFIGEHGYRMMCSWATEPEVVDRFAAELRASLA